MLPVFVSREHRLNIFCSCRTIKSFEKNEQMAAEQPPPVKEKHLWICPRPSSPAARERLTSEPLGRAWVAPQPLVGADYL